MRILVTIPHYFGPSDGTARHGSQNQDSARLRADALSLSIAALHQTFGKSHSVINIANRVADPANQAFCADVHVVVCSVPDHHLVDQLSIDESLYHHFVGDDQPTLIGFQCHKVLRDRWGNFDYYCFMEDDLIIRDPLLFRKLQWFNSHVGNDKLLQVNRFEKGAGEQDHKVYVDGDLRPDVTAPFQDVTEQPKLTGELLGGTFEFSRALNPHSGCFFLNADQMQHWINQPYFLDRDTSFVGPLESAATLGVMKAFKVYKPSMVNAGFLEVEHYGNQFLRLIRRV